MFQKIKAHFKLDLRPWQEKAVTLLSQQNDRQILWIVDPKGASGKTKLGQYLVYKKEFQLLSPMDEHNGAGVLQSAKEGYCFDLGRDSFQEGQCKKMSGMYIFLEKLKDGNVVSGKYAGISKFLGKLDANFQPIPPKLLVFSNTMPNVSKLTLDRLVVLHQILG